MNVKEIANGFLLRTSFEFEIDFKNDLGLEALEEKCEPQKFTVVAMMEEQVEVCLDQLRVSAILTVLCLVLMCVLAKS